MTDQETLRDAVNLLAAAERGLWPGDQQPLRTLRRLIKIAEKAIEGPPSLEERIADLEKRVANLEEEQTKDVRMIDEL